MTRQKLLLVGVALGGDDILDSGINRHRQTGTKPIRATTSAIALVILAAWPALAFTKGLGGSTPCGPSLPALGTSPETGADGHGLTLVSDGTIVYDSNQGLCWLADANLAGDPYVRAKLGVAGINPDGTMDYATALNWVNALNSYNDGNGYLGHNNWQLPTTPRGDPTCSSVNAGNFGISCTGSAFGNLYSVGLGRAFPDSVVAHFFSLVWPLLNLQPALYWTSDQDSGGEETFSFDTGLGGANTTKYNYLHVLPMAPGAIGTLPAGSGVLPYMSGPAAGRAVYDTNTDTSWTLDANLAAWNNFGVSGTTTIVPDVKTSVTVTVPLIDADGAMLLATAANAGGWLDAMNLNNYAGTSNWMLPTLLDLEKLYKDLRLQAGDVRLESPWSVGPFQHFQPFFYWSCERDANPMDNSQSACDPTLSPTPGFAFSFDFDDGFEGTDGLSKEFYVMVYYPAPGANPGASR